MRTRTLLWVAGRGIARHRVRLVATALAVALSVAFMAGTRVLGDTVRASLGEVWTDTYGGVDVVVRSTRTVGLDGDGQRDRVPETLAATVAATPGVAGVEGVQQVDLRVLGADGTPLRDGRVGASTWVIDWPDDPSRAGWAVTAGRAPVGPGQVVLDPVAARDGGYGVGDTVTIVIGGEPVTADAVGLVSFAAGASYAGAPALLADGAWLAGLLGQPATVDRIDVVAADGVTPEALVAQLTQAGLGSSIEAVPATVVSAESRATVAEVVDLFVQLVSSFGAIALFVGAFLIVNTFTIILSQRTRELALLRALGASRSQVLGSVVVEAVLVGAAAAVVGAAIAVPVAMALRALVARVGFTVPDTALVVAPNAFVGPIALAVVVTCLAALVPAWRVSRTPAVEAMRRSTVERVRSSIGRMVAAAGFAVFAVVLVVRATGERSDAATAAVLAAAVPAVVAFALAGPVITPPLVSVLGRPLARLSGITGRLARRNALRNPGRTSSTAAALLIGVSLVVVIAVASSSLAGTVSRVVSQTVQGDFVVSAGRSGVSTDVAPALAALPEVASAGGLRAGRVAVDGDEQFVLAVDPVAAAAIVDLGSTTGPLAGLSPDGVAVARSQAERDGVALGDTLTVRFPFGAEATKRVEVLYERGLTRNGEYLLSQAGWDPYLPEAARVDLRVLVDLAPGVDRDEAAPVLAAALEPWPGMELLDVGAFRDQQVGQVVSRISFLYVLLGLAVVVGLLGVANTLLLAVHERTRELGLLRTVGARPGQLGAAILQEAAVIAALGALVGVGLGVVLGWAMVDTLRFDDRITLTVPLVTLAAVGLGAVVAGVAAGLVPAWRAGRLPVLTAVAED